jgi:DNA-3-methyladenine glycosylase I
VGRNPSFAEFDPQVVAAFTSKDVERLLADPGIVRNRLKVESTIANARCVLGVQGSHVSFDAYLWGFVDGEPVVGRWKRLSELPAETDLSRAPSRRT